MPEENDDADLGVECPHCGCMGIHSVQKTRRGWGHRRRTLICRYCGERFQSIEKSVQSVEAAEKAKQPGDET